MNNVKKLKVGAKAMVCLAVIGSEITNMEWVTIAEIRDSSVVAIIEDATEETVKNYGARLVIEKSDILAIQ